MDRRLPLEQNTEIPFTHFTPIVRVAKHKTVDAFFYCPLYWYDLSTAKPGRDFSRIMDKL